MNESQFVWDHFKFNAEQRLKGFNFFVLLSMFADGGVFAALERQLNPVLLTILGIFTLILAIVFWLVDTRSRELLNLTIPALMQFETEFSEKSRLFSLDASQRGKVVRYTFAFRVLLVCQMAFGLGVAIFGAILSAKFI
jgi:hypothetical protein